MYYHFHIRPQLIMASVNAALLLSKCLTAKLTKYSANYSEVIMTSLSAILLSLSKFDQSPDANKDENKVMEVVEKAAQTFKEWIVHKDVGGSLFGGRVVDGHHMRELEV